MRLFKMKKLKLADSNLVYFVGIDPSAIGNPPTSGAIAVITYNKETKLIDKLDFLNLIATEFEVADYISNLPKAKILLEKVHIMPKQSAISMDKFIRGYGFLRGCLASNLVSYEDIQPKKWQSYFNLPKSDSATEHKNNLKAAAQRLFPSIKVTAKNQDAILIAYYALKTN
jgi:hypothetical protein